MARVLTFAAVTLAALPAWATGTMTVTGLDVSLLNAESCADEATSIDMTLDYDLVLQQQNVVLNVWWTSGSSCTTIKASGDDGFVGSLTIAPGDAVFPFYFPEDLDEPADATFTTQDVLDRAGACGAAAVDETVTLCFAIDLAVNGTTNGSVDSTEPWAQVDFDVDTEPPPAPKEPSVTPLDSSLKVKLSSSDDTVKDITHWSVRYREATGDTTTPCDEWDSYKETTASTESTVTVSGLTNSTEYELCGFAFDDADNVSTGSPVVTDMPLNETTFPEGYPPGKLEDGYGCSATAAPGWAALLAAAFFIRRRRGRA